MKQKGPKKRGKANYTVGYGRPPTATQFKKGTSGNTKGRPKGIKNLATLFQQEMLKKIPVVVNGERRMITKFEAAMMQVTNRAATGDPKAIQSMLNIARDSGVMNLPSQEPKVRTMTLRVFEKDLSTGESVRVKPGSTERWDDTESES